MSERDKLMDVLADYGCTNVRGAVNAVYRLFPPSIPLNEAFAEKLKVEQERDAAIASLTAACAERDAAAKERDDLKLVEAELRARIEPAARRVAEVLTEELKADRDAARAEAERLRGLLREAADNCQASTIESGISDARRQYRIELEKRLRAALAVNDGADHD